MENEMTIVDSVNNEVVKIRYKVNDKNDKWKLLNVVRTGEFNIEESVKH